MRRRPLILSLAAGAALTVAGCGKRGSEEMTSNPPPPPTENPDGSGDPTTGSSGNDATGGTLTDPPKPPEPPRYTNPPPPGDGIPLDKDQVAMAKIRGKQAGPSWDEVASPHPEGATNPPSPVLIVTPDGTCYKRWEGGMIPDGGDRVEVVTQDAFTTPIQCPTDRAIETYQGWVDKGRPDPTVPGFPPKGF